jgi:A-macroglobulin receptor binding domain
VQSYNERTTVSLVFEKIPSSRQVCVDFEAIRWFEVSALMLSPVKVYEYNQKGKKC